MSSVLVCQGLLPRESTRVGTSLSPESRKGVEGSKSNAHPCEPLILPLEGRTARPLGNLIGLVGREVLPDLPTFVKVAGSPKRPWQVQPSGRN